MAAVKKTSQKETPRWVLYATGAAMLTVILTIYWFSDNMTSLFESKPKPQQIYGAWVFDKDGFAQMMKDMTGGGGVPPEGMAQYQAMLKQTETRFGKVEFTFEKDQYVQAAGGKSVTVKCTYTGFAPNVMMVEPVVDDPKNPKNAQQPMHFSFDTKDKDKLFWNHMDSTVPMKRK